jgi:hypothetical protein
MHETQTVLNRLQEIDEERESADLFLGQYRLAQLLDPKWKYWKHNGMPEDPKLPDIAFLKKLDWDADRLEAWFQRKMSQRAESTNNHKK